MSGPLRLITHYIWHFAGQRPVELARDLYWNGATQEIDGKSYILTNPDFDHWPEPDQEQLSCGHRQDIRIWNGHKRYNLKRRCRACAMEAIAA